MELNGTDKPTPSVGDKIEAAKSGEELPYYSTVLQAQQEYTSYYDSDYERIDQYASIRGLKDGNPPYNPEELIEKDLSNSNFNDLSLDATLRAASQPYHSLMKGAKYTATFDLDLGEPDQYEWGVVLQSEFQKVLRKFKWFYHNNGILREQLVGYGWTIVGFVDEESCEFKTLQIDKVHVGTKASCNIDENQTIFVDSEYTIQELIDLWRKESKAKDAAWDVDALDELLTAVASTNSTLMTTFNTKFIGTTVSAYELEKRISEGSISYDDISTAIINVVSCYKEELNGKISRYIFAPEFNCSKFLYQAISLYTRMSDIFIVFTLSSGKESIHESKGHGWKAYPLAEQLIRSINNVADAQAWATTVFYQNNGIGINDNEDIKFFPGAATNLKSGQIMPNPAAQGLKAAIEAHQYLTQVFRNNLSQQGALPNSSPEGIEGSITDNQAMLRAHDEFELAKTDIDHFMVLYDDLVSSVFSRFIKLKSTNKYYKYLISYKKKCIDKGVPEEVFRLLEAHDDRYTTPDDITVKATRVAGDGSQVKQIASLTALTPYAGGFSAKGSVSFLKNVCRTYGTEDEAEMYTQGLEDSDNITGSASTAQLENNDIAGSQPVQFSRDNNHMAHLSMHIPFGLSVLEQLDREQIGIMKAYTIVKGVLDHSGPHLAAAGSNPFMKAKVEAYIKGYKHLAQQLPLIERNAQAAQDAAQKKAEQDQAATQTVMGDEERKDFQVKRTEDRKDYQVDRTVQRGDRANITRGNVEARKIVGKQATDMVKANYEGQAKIIKAQGEANSQ